MKISNLFLRGSVGLEGKMNDERMISQTPMVHKLDEVSSWCLADCLKYVRVSQWRRVNVVSVMLAGLSCCWPEGKREERGCVLSHIGWSVHTASNGRSEKGGREMISVAFLCCPEEVTQAEWHQSFSLGENMRWP